ncbi:restriction endonuclease subunit S [Chloroflexi bacterium CFX2]|nr:restriction endonuclease subunit S [Chloroflexi bacterium CFX2]
MSSREWEVLPLEDCMEAIIDYRGKTPRKSSFGIPLITAKIVKGGRILEPTEFIPFEDYDERMSRGIPRAGDVVVTTEAPLGEVGQLDNRKLSVGQRLITLRGKDGLLDNTYLKYLMMSEFVQNQLLARATGTTVSGIKQTELRKINLLVPPFTTQRRIADILSALDEKIELNRQTNATLEAIAQSIFREWFVEFNFPNTTDERVESELGMIPKGWKVLPLDEIADFLNGLALQKFPAENEKDYLPVIKIRELKNGVSNSSDKASRNIQSKYIINDGDLIFSWSGTLEVRFWVGGEGALNQHLFKVTSKEYPLWLCYFWILEHLANFRGIAEDKTTTMGHIQRHHLSEALCSIPDNLTELDKVMKPLVDKIINLEQQSATLASLRDALLPKLMNGEIEVSND